MLKHEDFTKIIKFKKDWSGVYIISKGIEINFKEQNEYWKQTDDDKVHGESEEKL